jgi:hypothetical protein
MDYKDRWSDFTAEICEVILQKHLLSRIGWWILHGNPLKTPISW